MSVPAEYTRLASASTVREQLRKVAGPVAGGHTTVLYTMDGAVYHKR